MKKAQTLPDQRVPIPVKKLRTEETEYYLAHYLIDYKLLTIIIHISLI